MLQPFVRRQSALFQLPKQLPRPPLNLDSLPLDPKLLPLRCFCCLWHGARRVAASKQERGLSSPGSPQAAKLAPLQLDEAARSPCTTSHNRPPSSSPHQNNKRGKKEKKKKKRKTQQRARRTATFPFRQEIKSDWFIPIHPLSAETPFCFICEQKPFVVVAVLCLLFVLVIVGPFAFVGFVACLCCSAS